MPTCHQCSATILNEAWVITCGRLLCFHCAQMLREEPRDPNDESLFDYPALDTSPQESPPCHKDG